jgi:hypothetical protein
MTCYDLALPSDPKEPQFLCEGEKHRVYIYTDRHGDTHYQGQFKTSYMGGDWWDDSDCCTTDEDEAIAWFNDNENSSYEEEEYEFDTSTLNSGVILDTLNGYKGNNIWEDVILHFDFEVTPIGDVDAFIMEDEDGDILRFYYNADGWTWRENNSFEEE